MAFWWIPMIAQAAASAAGGATQASNSIEGAKANQRIQLANIDLQKWLRDSEIKRRQPFTKAGGVGLKGLGEYRAGTYDPSRTGIYQSRLGAGMNALGDFSKRIGHEGAIPEYARNRFTKNLSTNEFDAQRGRFLDLVKIGQGNATSTGQSYSRTGNAIGSLYQNIGGNLSQARQASYPLKQQWLGNFVG
jgi:hypothetical protein